MAKTNLMDLKTELVVNLRNADVISISDRGVTTSQDTGTFSTDSSHTLATNPTTVKNVRNVEVASSDLVFGDDFTVNYTTGVISFTSPQTGAYVIDYDQGTTDRIFPDFPQAHLKLNQFPRVAIDVISGVTKEVELGGGSNFTDYLMSITAYDKDQSDVENLISNIRAYFQDNKSNLYYSVFVTPVAMGPILISTFGKNKIFQRNQDFNIRFVYED